MRLLTASVEGLGIRARRLPSGAGHDAMAFRGVLPLAMLFVRCRGGISHHPSEHASAADIDVAARVLTAFIASYASESDRNP
jgi:allantoate deiminase